jgi:hypothetical protein
MVTSPAFNPASWASSFYAQGAEQPQTLANSQAGASSIPNINPVQGLSNPQTTPTTSTTPAISQPKPPNPLWSALKTMGLQLVQVLLGGLLNRLFA